METDRSSTQILEEILEHQKKELRFSRIVSIVSLALVGVILLMMTAVLPKAARLFSQSEDAIEEIHTFVGSSKETIEEINTFVSSSEKTVEDVDTFVKNANELLANNTQAVTEAIEKINAVDFPALGNTLKETGEKLQSIDFDTLNKAIRELEAVIRPLSDFFGLFER